MNQMLCSPPRIISDMPPMAPPAAPSHLAPYRSSTIPYSGPVRPAKMRRSVSAQPSALFDTSRSALMGPMRNEKTTALSGEMATLIARDPPTMNQP